jgi:hypothetical protein
MVTRRNACGNMLLLVVLTIGLLIATGLCGITFNRFLGQRTRAQSKIDALALSLAGSINDGNRVAQINHLTEYSRELVYLSRQSYNQCLEQELTLLQPLCFQLVEEARAGNELVENERRNQLKSICLDLQRSCAAYNRVADKTDPLAFLGLSTGEPRIESLYLGSVVDTESNVISSGVIKGLADLDLSGKYVEPKSSLYRANINARLPEDGDLNFKLSCLPPCVEGSVAPARNANPEAFKAAFPVLMDGTAVNNPAAGQLPCAVQLVCSMKASLPAAATRGFLNLRSTGVTGGDSTVARR